jgi:hypothetical protein
MAAGSVTLAGSKDYVPRPAETEAEVLSMGFPNTGDHDRDVETHMNRMANAEPPRDKEEDELPEEEEEGKEENEE